MAIYKDVTTKWATSKGPFKNHVTDGGREGGLKNLQILVTNSDKGGREVGRNGDILAPKNSFLHFSFLVLLRDRYSCEQWILRSIQNIFHHLSFRRKEKL